MKGCGWVPFGSLEMEKAKRASDILNEVKPSYVLHTERELGTCYVKAPKTTQAPSLLLHSLVIVAEIENKQTNKQTTYHMHELSR